MLRCAREWTSVVLAGKRDSRRHSTTSFSENVVVAETSYQNVRSFIVLQTVEGLTSNKGKSANVSCENKYSEAFQGVHFLKIREKTVNQISYS